MASEDTEFNGIFGKLNADYIPSPSILISNPKDSTGLSVFVGAGIASNYLFNISMSNIPGPAKVPVFAFKEVATTLVAIGTAHSISGIKEMSPDDNVQIGLGVAADVVATIAGLGAIETVGLALLVPAAYGTIKEYVVNYDKYNPNYGGYQFGGEWQLRRAAETPGDGADDQMIRALYKAHDVATNAADLPGL
jgi:hypothetical protein